MPLIIVCDAAADPKYEFADASNLARTVRIDLGADIRWLGADELSQLGLCVQKLCGAPSQFKGNQQIDQRCLLLGRIDYDDHPHPSLMIIIKPRVPENAPPDVAAYQQESKAFPQEPTADQFFGEAQWESYRKLGQTLGQMTFGSNLLDELIMVQRSWQIKT